MRTIQKEQGVIAIFLSVIVGILLLTTTTFAARVSVNELSQSSAVDRSEQAYYAAEAGIEEAIRRLDNNPYATTCQIFPEQFYSGDPTPHTSPICPTSQPGDRYQLTDDTGSGFPTAIPRAVYDNDNTDEYGQTSWRHRKVYAQNTSYSGTQAKDQTVQFDTSELRRRCVGSGAEAGANGLDCNGSSSIFANYKGIKYCWTDPINVAKIEVSVVSFDSNYTNFLTEKSIITHGVNLNRASASFYANGATCTDILINNPSRRYIFRLKPIFAGAAFNGPVDVQQYRFAITYQAALIETPTAPPATSLYIPDDTYLIDVIGQSGDIKRRLVAKKERKGRLLGIFDYVLYSGDSTKDLCKSGVNSTDVTYDPNTCTVVTNSTAPSSTTMTYNNRTDASLIQQPPNPCDAPTSDAAAASGNTLQLCSSADTFVYNYTYAGPAGSVNKFYIDARQDIDTGAPGPAQIRVILTTNTGTVNQIVNASGTSYAQYAINISSLGLNDGDTISVSLQFINDSCTGCSQSPRPANTDLNAYIDYFGVTNGSSLP